MPERTKRKGGKIIHELNSEQGGREILINGWGMFMGGRGANLSNQEKKERTRRTIRCEKKIAG